MKTPQKAKFRLKPRVMDVLFFVSGLVIGEAIAFLTKNIGFLKWLSHDVSFGFEEPLPLSFLIFKIEFGFSIHLNPAVILFSLLGLIGGRYLLASSKQKKSTSAQAYEYEYEDDQQ